LPELLRSFGGFIMRLSILLAAICLTGCAATPPKPVVPVTLSDEAFAPLLKAAFQSDKMAEWEPPAKALLARTDLRPDQRADVYFQRRIKRGVFVATNTVATPQCAVADIDKGLALVSEGVRADAARRDRVYQVSRYQYFVAPGNCD